MMQSGGKRFILKCLVYHKYRLRYTSLEKSQINNHARPESINKDNNINILMNQ